jgi:hypothetical protein
MLPASVTEGACRKALVFSGGKSLRATSGIDFGIGSLVQHAGERSSLGWESTVSGPGIIPRLELSNADGDDATHAHNTLSAESTRVRVFYPFHPLHGSTLQIVRRPKRGDGAVSVVDATGGRLKIPLWMLLPDAAEMKIAERPYLSKEALLCLTALIMTPRDVEDHVRDNLLQTVVDGRRGGQRVATRTSGPDDPKGRRRRVDRRHGANRTDQSHGPHSGGGLSNGRRKS